MTYIIYIVHILSRRSVRRTVYDVQCTSYNVCCDINTVLALTYSTDLFAIIKINNIH